MASPHSGFGTVTTDTTTDSVVCSGYVTLAAQLDSGSGTWTWQFKGPDGVWRSIYGGNEGTTEQAFTASHMINAYFGNDVQIRGSATGGTNPQWDWQIFSNIRNRL
jgi:hypothetical protein